MKTIKKAAKIGASVLIFTAVTSAVAGYMFAKRNEYAYDGEWFEDDDEEEDDDDEEENGIMGNGRMEKVKDIVRAGKEMKEAWDRIEDDLKILAKDAAKRTKKTVEDAADAA